MPGTVPRRPKIYHIVHLDRLASILDTGYLLSDSSVLCRRMGGTVIGDSQINERRLRKRLSTYPALNVGDCVPFYFCPRSVLLYLNWKAGQAQLTGTSAPESDDGQDRIVHLVADLETVVRHANANKVRWVFTNVNASTDVAQDHADLSQLDELDWDTINARDWKGNADRKAAEFLVEGRFPAHLVERMGVKLQSVQHRVVRMLQQRDISIPVTVMKNWYYGT